MLHDRPAVAFYVPSVGMLDNLPDSIEEYWPWIDEAVRTRPAMLGNGDGPCTWAGPYNWTIQTFLYLRRAGFPCELSASLPDAGIVISHGDFLPPLLQPSARRFVVEIKPDRLLQCLFANVVIVQNRRDPIRRGVRRLFIDSAFVNYWPQPGLIRRNRDRGDRFENVCFVGNREQFVSDVAAVEAGLQALGLRWEMRERDRWHDYSEIDAIVAIRPLDEIAGKPRHIAAYFSPDRKPASKLYNAWLAGVPAVLSPEVAFRDLQRSHLDYLEARSVPDLISQVARLQRDPKLRQAMIANGERRAREFSAFQTTQAWQSMIADRFVPAFAAWTRSSARRRVFEQSRRVLRKLLPVL